MFLSKLFHKQPPCLLNPAVTVHKDKGIEIDASLDMDDYVQSVAQDALSATGLKGSTTTESTVKKK